MADLLDRRSIEQRISATSDPRETAVVLAARAALRALPLMVYEYDLERSKGALEFPFRIFSGANIAWAVARFPQLRVHLRPIARRARSNQYGMVSSVTSSALLAADRAAGAAPFAAGPAAAEAASAAIETARELFSSAPVDFVFANDLESLEKGLFAPHELAAEPLWVGAGPSSVPDKSVLAYRALCNVLSRRPNWDVWMDWYDARLSGDPSEEHVEAHRTSIVGKYPASAIKTINAELAGVGQSSAPAISWASKLASLEQTRLGARFVQKDNKLTIDPQGDETDLAVAREPITLQLHEGIKRRAREFSEIAKRVDNQIGWKGLGAAAVQFRDAVECTTEDVPGRIGLVYDSTISLGSFLDLDTRLRSASGKSNVDPLELEVQRAFVDLIRSAAPWLRRFPTARMLDDEAGAFLTKTEDFEAAARIVEIAETTNVISAQDLKLLGAIVEAARRGGFQGEKAGARTVWSSKNLVTAIALVFSFEAGLINNKAAEQSIVAQNGARLYLKAEAEILKLFESAPEDIKQAVAALIDDLRRFPSKDPANLPQAPKERFDRSRRPEEGAADGN